MTTPQRLVLLGAPLAVLALLAQFGTLFLLVASVIVVAFTGVAWRRAYVEFRADRQWRADKARYRAELAAKGYTVLPANVALSSVLDDSDGPLPDEWRAPCGEVIRTGHGQGLLWTPTPGRDETRSLFPLASDPSTNDRGPKAA